MSDDLLDSQNSIILIADAIEIVLRCGVVYGSAAAASSAMPKVSVLLPRFADLWRGGSAQTAFEFIDSEMNLVEFVLLCLVCAVGRPTGGFTSVADAEEEVVEEEQDQEEQQQQQKEEPAQVSRDDAFYDAFRCSRDVRRTCDIVSRKPLPPVLFNVVASDQRHSTCPRVKTIYSVGNSSNSSNSNNNNSSSNSAPATIRSNDDNSEVADMRAIAATVFRAAQVLLTTAERGGNRVRGRGAEFYDTAFATT
jgi:hypothetical protein